MTSLEKALHEFAQFAAKLKGDEKSEAQSLKLNFLFPRAFQPLFAHNWVHVTREAARDVAHAFNSLVARGEDRVRARRFILQCVVAMFAEDSRASPGANRLRDAHAALDSAVSAAYGMKEKEDILGFLLRLNLELADKELKGEAITPPGLPALVSRRDGFVSRDYVSVS